ncbi:5-methylcytosine-specific restriction endonuclease system specificity protein McrC [Faecalicoccus pleomorphus]|uniref:5-methylcytosine-specific restriction endonuclease system specificity protein McrC n=1 Tax=Faecalicoccus pleomorphus TaxID=1323 RepID=A0A3E3E8T7_9FIRM|nr:MULTISPECIES: 5-methylcytosine-specific restriction endonuclease system specificity protein McrC [Faecalicoccus]MDY5110538.1 5-methylcytosine-specific restriction endonuclease system specificity protein McrC [Faecalicoccus sp.]RGD78389.1 5-methylcytosine-specific restriction endonuclease system specificity protein McrC [Faecalicoccus pleomorphus]
MICVKNIYYMLSYAFQILNEQGYKQILTEEFDNVAELCAAILSKGVALQVKRGLRKEYLINSDSLSTLRGKIDISVSIREQSLIKRQLVCSYDEFSVNSYMNCIIKTTMELLLHSGISKGRKKDIRKLLVYFADVSFLEVNSINWKLQFNKNNQTYQMLISICYLIIKGLLQTKTDGTTELMDFLDEQRMSRLYEKFILEYYRKEHKELDVSSSQIPWNLDNDESSMLPVMQSDIMLHNKGKTLIIDAKYYSKSMQVQYDVHTVRSNHLYQIYAYVKNYDKDKSGDVMGLLLYAKTDEDIIPHNTYQMDGNTIMVDTLDLNCDFNLIRQRLDQIVKKHF